MGGPQQLELPTRLRLHLLLRLGAPSSDGALHALRPLPTVATTATAKATAAMKATMKTVTEGA